MYSDCNKKDKVNAFQILNMGTALLSKLSSYFDMTIYIIKHKIYFKDVYSIVGFFPNTQE